MKTAFIFPGQGAQYVGMAKDLYENYTEVKNLYKSANEILGFELDKVSFEGPEEKLKQTYITQPAIFVHSLALNSILFSKFEVKFAAGHSLGEYSALVCAGALNFETGLKLVKLRGELMQQAGERQKGTMAAIIGMDGEKLVEVCKEASEAGIVQVANFNSPGQLVISGSVEGVRKAMELAKANKAKLVKELVVHGAFHSPIMEPAKEEFKIALEEVEFSKLNFPVYVNVTGNAITPDTKPNEIRDLLYNQLTSSVRWEDCVRNMARDGADDFVELGPGKVLQGLVKRICPNVSVKGFDKAEELSGL
ncbi:MAG: [acyl-carrier-protein] S-malonyltransferase [Ignavibacteriae bacterium]|nr:MAG: [acyl-carrier-protein] S-malonyltransferase [Ignavibacteriota bacterium]